MGVVMYILLSGKVPFPGRNEVEIIGNVIKGEFHFDHDSFTNASLECKDLICHLLVKDQTKRFDADQALNHPWIVKYSAIADSVGSTTTLTSKDFEEMRELVDRMKQKKATLSYLATKIPEKNFDGLK